MRALLLMILLLSPMAIARADAPAPMTAEQELRYRGLISQLRCLVCQNQTIADSSAPLALDLREQVQRQLVAGRSEDQIRGYLTDRYGDFVLYKPPLRTRTVALWIGPFVLLGAALFAAWRFTRGSRAAATGAAPANVDALRRLLDDEDRRA